MDTIANFLTIIRNGYFARKATVTAPFSRTCESLAKIMVKNGFLTSVEKTATTPVRLVVTLNYLKGEPLVTHLERISKPGVRQYVRASEIITQKSGAGISIISTSKGLMTDKDARSASLGGEVICQIW